MFQNCGSPMDFTSKDKASNQGLEVAESPEENLETEPVIDPEEEVPEPPVFEEEIHEKEKEDNEEEEKTQEEEEDESVDLGECLEKHDKKAHRNLLQNSSFERADSREGLVNHISLKDLKSRALAWDLFDSLPGKKIKGERAEVWFSESFPLELMTYDLVIGKPLRKSQKTRHVGNLHLELDSSGNSVVSQEFISCNREGQYVLSFLYASRTGNESSGMNVYINDELITSIDGISEVRAWKRHKYTISNLPDGLHKLRLEATGSSDGLGALVDNVRIHQKRLSKPGVVTILMALGDKHKDELVIDPKDSKRLIRNAVRYASGVKKPRILLVRDRNHRNEDLEDSDYIREKLYPHTEDVDFIEEPSAGLSLNDLADYDLVWWNNPGNVLASSKSLDTLLAFDGGVVISGDDVSRGAGNLQAKVTKLTGLKYLNNGASYQGVGLDNNNGQSYQVVIRRMGLNKWLEEEVLEGKVFFYGNDIDHTEPAREKLKIFATGTLDHLDRELKIPVMVGYKK